MSLGSMFLDSWDDKFKVGIWFQGWRVALGIGICWCCENWRRPLISVEFMCWTIDIGWVPMEEHQWLQYHPKENNDGKEA